MKKNAKFLTKLLIGLSAVSLLTGCNKDNSSSAEQDYVPEVVEVPKSEYYLVNNGITEFQLVYPANSQTAYISYALTEFMTFFEQATGSNINAIKDSDIINPNGYYISLGNTTLLADAGIVPNKDLGYSGYGIKLIDKVLYIYASDLHKDEGVLNGVYRVLNDAFKYEAFAADEIYVEPTHTRKLLAYDEVFIPTFDIRELGYRDLLVDSDYRRRMRQITRFGDSPEWVPGFYAHSQINKLLTREKYGTSDPDFFLPILSHYGNLHWGLGVTYNESSKTLSFNDRADALRDAMANEIINVLNQYPDRTMITIGEEDEPQFCTCDNCRLLMEKVAGYQSGLQIIFVNRVIDKVEEWMATAYPGREMQYVIFAYHGATITPPCKKDSSGTYHALSEYVIPHEKMYIEYAPIAANYDHSFYDSQNLSFKEYIDGWNFLAPNRLTLWTYCTNFSNYFVNFNDFATYEPNVRFFAENGVNYYFGQGAHNARTPTLTEMRIFVESSLIYNVNKESYDSLARRFMNAYYKEAGEDLYRYMSLLRENYLKYQINVKDQFGSIYSKILDDKLYTEAFVDKIKQCLDDGLQHISHLATTDPDKYQLLHDRIMAQYCSVYFIILKLYKSLYTESQVAEFKANLYKYAELNKYDHATESSTFDSTYFG